MDLIFARPLDPTYLVSAGKLLKKPFRQITNFRVHGHKCYEISKSSWISSKSKTNMLKRSSYFKKIFVLNVK